MSSKSLLIIGAHSDIAQAVAKKYASEGFNLLLACRNSQRLKDIATDLSIRFNVSVVCIDFDVLDASSHLKMYQSLPNKPLGVMCAIGYLGDQCYAQSDANELALITETNYTAIAQFLEVAATEMIAQKAGFIIGISSVAGDRGRKSNYVYGASKAAFTAYLSGLRNRLHSHGIKVLTVKPGFVRTSMTDGMKLPETLTAQPDSVARDIYNAQSKGRNTIYTKSIWFVIMNIIKLIPEFIFKKLNL